MSLIQRMLDAAETAYPSFLTYIKVRSSNPGKWVFILEGYEDVPFYQAQTQQIDSSLEFVPVVVHGKHNVLDLRQLCKARNGDADTKVRFFVDHDFDGIRGYESGDDLYVTPTYSIENLCCTEEVFQRIMEGEFKLEAEEALATLPRLRELFTARRSEFLDCLRDAHALLYKSRTTGTPAIRGIDDRVRRYVSISLEKVESIVEPAQMAVLLGIKDEVGLIDFEIGRHGYSQLDDLSFARGKFLFGFFVEILKILKEDRCTAAPSIFPKRRSISFSPDTDQIRAFASCAAPTACLRRFIEGLTGSTLMLAQP